MGKNRFLFAIVILIGAIMSCGNTGEQKEAVEKSISVTVARAEFRDLSLSAIYTGTLEGYRQAQIFASIPEAVVKLPVKEGGRVNAGDPVILLDKEGAASRYNQENAVYLEAGDNYRKMSNLYNNGAVSQQAFNSAKTAFEVAEANFESARQQVELTSPIAGIVTNLSVNVGEYARVGIPIATVAQTETMRLVVYVENRNITFIKKGQKAEISVDLSGDNPEISGEIKEVAESADPDTRLFRVEIQIDNKMNMLKPGMFARARITTTDLKNVLTVPKESIFSVDGIFKVYTVKNGKAKETTIGVGESSGEFSVVTSGLARNDTVVVIGRNLVEDGSPVEISDSGNEAGDKNSSQEGSGNEG